VADDDASLGNQPPNQIANRKNGLDAVMDEIDLVLARQLALNRAPDDFLIELDDVGLNRRRSFGGVSIIDMSRMPMSDMFNVAESASRSW